MKKNNPAAKSVTRTGKKRGPIALDPGADTARQRILTAARKIFSTHPFKSASTRMIAQEARIEHPLIHYYFGSKEKLYDAVCEVLYEDFAVANRTWLEGLDKTLPKTGLPIYLDKLIDYTYRNPEPLMLISLNMSQFGSNEEIPGFRYLHLHMERVRQTVEEKIPLAGPKEEIRMFIYCLNNLVINLLGPRRTQAMLLNMDPDGPEYRQWVKDAMLKLFLPWLTELIFPPKKD